MRGQLQALICLGSLAALSFPATAAQAATQATQATQAASAQTCRVVAAKPVVTRGVVRGTATRTGCTDQARLRVRIHVVASGSDRVLKSGSKTVGTGRITAGVRCSPTPRSYYVVAVDSKGRGSRSRPVRLSCASGGGFASSIETEVVKITNRARAKKGCRPLIHDPRLHLAAERHSADMGENNYFSHDSRDGRTFDRRIRAAGFSFSSAAENIAMGQPTAASVMSGWLKSSANRANILNCSFTHIGVGHNAKGPTWTQILATP